MNENQMRHSEKQEQSAFSAAAGNKHRRNAKAMLLVCCFIIGLCGFGLHFFSMRVQAREYTESGILRLHVIADSDSEYDQALKLEVRDRIITVLREELAQVQSEAEAEALIASMLPRLEYEANAVLAGRADYRAQAELCDAEFPTKSYAELVLPAGRYRALRIVLGSGEGKNWWCVLFPSLCFVDAVGEVTDAMAVFQGKHQLLIKWKLMELLRGK